MSLSYPLLLESFRVNHEIRLPTSERRDRRTVLLISVGYTTEPVVGSSIPKVGLSWSSHVGDVLYVTSLKFSSRRKHCKTHVHPTILCKRTICVRWQMGKDAPGMAAT